MAQTGYTPIQLYRTTTAGAAPTAANLNPGELALNTTDEKLYFKNASGTVKLLASTAGSTGDVVGPGSATDSALVAFDGTTGKLIKQAANVTVAQGGTGTTTLTANNVILGNGTSAVQFVAPGTSGNVLTSNGTTWTSAAAPTFTQVYPGAGIAVSTGTAWGTSKTSPTGDIVGTTDTQTLTNKTLTAPTMTGAVLNDGYTEEVFAVTGTTPALSPTNGSIQTWTLSGASTPTAGTWAAGQSITLMIDDGSAATITWTSLAVTWKTDGGSAPTLNTSGYTVVQLWKVGTVIYGARVGDA